MTIFQREFAAEFCYPALYLSTFHPSIAYKEIATVAPLVNNLRGRFLRHLGLQMLCEDCVQGSLGKGGHFILSPWAYDIMQSKSNPSLLMDFQRRC